MRQDRLLEIVGRIYQWPNKWHQPWYHNQCKTAFCVAGHAIIDSGGDAAEDGPGRAQAYLELTDDEAVELFDASLTMSALIRFAVKGSTR